MFLSKKSKVTVTSYYCKKCGVSKFIRSIDPEFDGICKICGQPMEKGNTEPYNMSNKVPSHLKNDYHEAERKYRTTVLNNNPSAQTSRDNPHAITCPYCGSANCKKISVGHRWLSTGLFGLASSDIGKQWKCNGCRSKF